MKFENKLGSYFKLSLLFVFSLCLVGCATLSYVGDDYSPENTYTIKTNEEFLFNVYKKTIDNVNVKVGITRTSVAEILAIIVQVENMSYETPYTFKVSDLKVFDPEKEIQFLSTNTYLSVWQTQEASSMSAVGSLGTTISTMTGLNGSYNEYNQAVVQNNNQQNAQTTIKRLDNLGNGISQHTVRSSSVIGPRKSQYYYFFFEDTNNFPIKVNYRDLSYQFNL